LWHDLKAAFVCLVVVTVLTGVLYPLAITGLAQAFFPSKANGSIIVSDGKDTGSSLIGQEFHSERYFWGRLSGGSNLGPLNPELVLKAKLRIEALKNADPGLDLPVPVDLVTASGSGLDPDISPEAAELQIERVANARGLSAGVVKQIVQSHMESRQLGVLGEPRVNVLALNLALDKVK
jgi:potassium-transporting ATPase KdpC subunit